MASTVGRNAPCPCGSGRKYKKCCLDKDEAQSRQPTVQSSTQDALAVGAVSSGVLSQTPELKGPSAANVPCELSPAEQRWERFFLDFDPAPLDRRLELACEAVETEPDFDSEWAFELCGGVIRRLQRESRLDEVDAFLDLIRARQPAVAEEEAHWLASYRTENALLREKADVRTALLAWVPHARRNLPFFEAMLDRLRFHNRIDDAIAATESAWPLFRSDPKLHNPEKWFLRPAVELVIDRAVDSQPALSPDDPTLWMALEPFLPDLDQNLVQEEVRVRAAASPRAWQAVALASSGENAEKNLHLLCMDFRDMLRLRLGWSLARAELGREELVSALLSWERSLRSKSKEKRLPIPTGATDWLLPNPDGIEEHIKSLADSFTGKSYRVAALTLALFPWLSFLVELGFLQAPQARSIADKLRERLESLPALLDRQVYDPVLKQDLEWALRKAAHRGTSSPMEERSPSP